MKILVVADLHYSLHQYDWLMQAASGYDMVIIAGDLLDTNSMVDPGAQVVVVTKYLKRLRANTHVVVCSGNHDLDELNGNGEKHARWLTAVKRLAIAADGDTLIVGDTTVTVCAWWDGPFVRQAIAAQLEAAAALRRGSWIWVYHAPPTNSPVSWAGQRSFGDAALDDWIGLYRPDYVFSGHVHEAPFARGGSWVDRIGDTWMFNAGRQSGTVPTTICLDTEAAEAAWFSLEGAESVSLRAPLIRPLPPLTEMPTWMTQRGAGPVHG